MVYLLKMVIFNSYVKLPDGKLNRVFFSIARVKKNQKVARSSKVLNLIISDVNYWKTIKKPGWQSQFLYNHSLLGMILQAEPQELKQKPCEKLQKWLYSKDYFF
jgi:hypothetical protein